MLERQHSRRTFLRYSAMLSAGVALIGLPGSALADQSSGGAAPASHTEPGGEIMLDDPNARQGEFVDVNGATIFYQVTGQGMPMLLIHGYPLSGALFSRVRDALSAQYQVITIDLRGYGMSETPSIPDSIAVYADDALAVLDHLGIQQAIVGGMSMGGPISLEMYQRAPERFAGLILIDTIAAAAMPPEAGLWQGTAEAVEMGGIASIIPGLMKEMLTGATRMAHPELVEYLTAVMLAASDEAGIGGAIALATRPDYTALLPTISVPTLVFVGLEDSVYPIEIAMMMHEAIPTSDLAIIPAAAHAAIFEAPEESSMAILDWAAEYFGGEEPGETPEPAPGSMVFTAALLPQNQVPGPGASSAFGFAKVFIDAESGQICYRLSVANLLPTAAHIHEGDASVAGPVVVPFEINGGLTNACTMADPALAAAIIANPAGYYVNVHSEAFPAGAIRGQLMTP